MAICGGNLYSLCNEQWEERGVEGERKQRWGEKAEVERENSMELLCSELWFLCPCSLLDSFDAVPGHLTEDLHLYSLSDLSATKKGDLVPRLTELLKAGSLHVEKCMVSPLPLPPAWLRSLRFTLGGRFYCKDEEAFAG